MTTALESHLATAIRAMPTDGLDPFELAKLHAMIAGYLAMWNDRDVEVLAVEREFQFPLTTGARTWLLGGKIDLVLRIGSEVVIYDHKTSGEDVSAGSTYRERLILNGQVTQYLWGAAELGWEADRFVFDVLCKPRHKVTAADKTPAHYRDRIANAIGENPSAYYARIEVSRSEAERTEYVRRIHDDAALVDHVHAATLQTPNEGACFNYSAPCEFWRVCSGTASLDDTGLYQLRSHKHDELETPVPDGAQLMTNSRRQAFNTCRRKHHYGYELGYRSVEESKNLRIGTAIHAALEAYWRKRMEEQGDRQAAE